MSLPYPEGYVPPTVPDAATNGHANGATAAYPEAPVYDLSTYAAPAPTYDTSTYAAPAPTYDTSTYAAPAPSYDPTTYATAAPAYDATTHAAPTAYPVPSAYPTTTDYAVTHTGEWHIAVIDPASAVMPAQPVAYAEPIAPPIVDPTVQRGGTLEARNISAWFGTNKVLERVSLDMPANTVTALIGPSGCGKSTFLRILNRMHELVGSAQLNGEVLLDGKDIYASGHRITETRNRIGMVFQKPNPFPAMSIADNVTAGLKLTGTKISKADKEVLIESSLTRAGLWKEVKDRLKEPGSALSGGQQQRLCIARSLAVEPEVLLMDEPCSALDPTSTRRVEETIHEIKDQVTIVIVTHNMQQAARVSQQCAFFLAELGTPGQIVEAGDTETIFNDPIDPRTYDYVNGRFG